MKTEGERIAEIISHFCDSKADFARKIGERPQTVSNWVSRGAGKNILNRILALYPEINPNWLLTGEGEMLKAIEKDTPYTTNANECSTTNSYTTYLLPMSAIGGSLTGFALPGAELKDCEKIISPIENVDFAITVYGESMAPEYPSGSRVLIKKIDPSLFIEWGKVYVLDTPNGVIIKEVLQCKEKEGYVMCHSINPKFADFEVSLADVFGMYRVLMCLAIK